MVYDAVFKVLKAVGTIALCVVVIIMLAGVISAVMY